MSFVVGDTIGPYRLSEQLGQGGMATVYKAYHPSLDRYVAIKALHPAFLEEANFLARFQREAKVVARLEHPNIVPVYDFAEHEGRPYLVMKYIQGETLKARLAKGPLEAELVVRIVDSVGQGLSYAHRQGILHRDVKPSNIILANDGQIYLADFGLARIAEAGESTLSSDTTLGTPQYISPEQALGKRELDAGTDIYSFGVVLYEMLVGQVPFSADTPFAVIHDHIFTPLPLPRSMNPDVSEPVERVLLRALAKERSERFIDVAEVVASFKTAFSDPSAPADDQTIAAPRAEPKPPAEAAAAAPSAPAPAAVIAAVITSAADSGSAAPTGGVAASPDQVHEKLKRRRLTCIAIPVAVLFMCACLFMVLRLSDDNRQAGRLPPAPNHVAELERMIGDDPNNPQLYLDLAMAYMDDGQAEPAHQAYDTAIRLGGEDAGFIVRAAEELYSRQMWLETTEAYARAASLQPGTLAEEQRMHFAEAVYRAYQDPEAAARVSIKTLAQADPYLAGVAEARLELHAGRPLLARAAVNVLLRRQERDPLARLVLAEVEGVSGSLDEARMILQDLSASDAAPRWVRHEAETMLREYQP